RARLGRRGPDRGRHIVPDAHRRALVAAALAGSSHASRRDPRLDRWPAVTVAPGDPARRPGDRPEPTFRGTPPFPQAAVAAITHAAGAREVVKVKSMATQEIELNEALRLEGIDVWETDLAEMIVQLGHDLPSHILVPAIHRNRSEIRDIFIDEMGRVGRPAPAGLTDAPPELAEAARLHLRQKLLRARAALSGPT